MLTDSSDRNPRHRAVPLDSAELEGRRQRWRWEEHTVRRPEDSEVEEWLPIVGKVLIAVALRFEALLHHIGIYL